MKIQLIWAQDESGGIGKQGQLPWHISEDLKNFKRLTLNQPVIMGRITWESLPVKPLPKRRNIVLSHSKLEEVECYTNVDNCVNALRKENIPSVFVIGGANIYASFLEIATDLHITMVKENTKGIDRYFPITLNCLKDDFKTIEEIYISTIAVYTHWIRK